MPKYTVILEETVVNKAVIEANSPEEALAKARTMDDENEFPNDMPERQGGKIMVYGGDDKIVAETELN